MNCCKFCQTLLVGSSRRRWCDDRCRQKWNYQNKPKPRYRSQRDRGFQNKLKAIHYKGGKCETCQEPRPAALCFHHKKPETKSFGLDARTFSNYKWSTVLEELDKCSLLCHNCHHILHNGAAWDEYASSDSALATC